MPLERVSRSEPLSRSEFHARLARWLGETGEPIIGDPAVSELTAWIWISAGEFLAKLHADTKREGVEAYLRLVEQFGDDLRWTIAESRKGQPSKFVFGPDGEAIPGFYLYLADAQVGQFPPGASTAEKVVQTGARPYILAETNWKAVHRTAFDVAVLPWGATEAHNWHLPYATDAIQCDAVAAESARRAWERGTRVAVLPTVPFGVQTGQLDIPFCVNLNPSTQLAILRDVVQALAGQGVRRLVILNGHGGNDFRAMIRELQPQTDCFLCAINWWNCVDPRPYFAQPGDHAGELETSVMMHVAPHLVLPLEEAGSGAERKARITGLREGWAWAPRRWTAVTDDTGVGDPSAATPEKGATFLDAVAERISGFLVELAAADLDDLYADTPG